MDYKFLKPILMLALTMGVSATATAALFDRGNGMIYDSDQNITWLQDANYALTSGYPAAVGALAGTMNDPAQGRMALSDAMSWVGSLNYGGYSDWRLPTIVGPDITSWRGCGFSSMGIDCGYNIETSGSEMAYMWYDILGNTVELDAHGNQISCGSSVTGCLTSTGADGVNFLNLQPDDYWSGWCCSQDDGAYFNFRNGYQSNVDYRNEIYAWAVRSGDVATVPELNIFLLLLSGLAGIVAIKRRHF